jgi:glutamate racemase
VTIHTQVCPGLVEAIESGAMNSSQTNDCLQGCLDPLLAQGIDQLVLGCTHYPFLDAMIRSIVGRGVAVIDPAPAVARQLRRILDQRAGLAPRGSPADHRFLTTGSTTAAEQLIAALLGLDVAVAQANWASEQDIRIA